MSKLLETSMTYHAATQFWGGDSRGVCVQISTLDNTDNYLQLTMTEASALVNTLMPFIKEEAQRRQGLLREQIAKLKDVERSVFNEIGELSPEFFETQKLCVELVDKFCPKARGEK